MATRQAVWGIDVGQCALKAVKLQAAGDKVEILAYDVVDHEKILSHPEVDAAACIKAALEKFTSRNDLKGDLVAIAVPGQQTLSRFTKLPPVEAKKIPDIVKFEAGQQIPFDMDEVVWDYQTFSEPDSPDVEVGIFAIRKELIRNHIEFFTKAGIEPMLVQASPLALYNAVRYDKPASEKATILLDVGAQATDLIVVEGSAIWARPVPIGGNAFTEALVKAFKLSHAKAENLKRTATTTKYARQVFQAMRPVFADLIAEVQRSIGFYTATHRESQVASILGVGNAFKLPGLQKFMQQNLQIEVDRFAAFSKVVESPVTSTPEFADAAASLVVAYGLALQGLGLAPVASSLLPPEIAKQLVWRKKQPLFWAAAASLMLSAGVIWGANASAQNTIRGKLGDSDGPMVSTADQAENNLRGSANGLPREYAGIVSKSISKLNGDYQAAEQSVAGADLGLFAKLGQSVPLIPRIYKTLHDAIALEAPGIRGAHDGQEYVQKIEDAKREREDMVRSGVSESDPRVKAKDDIINRAKRNEIWIDNYLMDYVGDLGALVQDATMSVLMSPADKTAVNSRPGWLVQIVARTTRPEAAGWLEDHVLRRLESEGCKPKTGFYVYKAYLKEIGPIRESGNAAAPGPGPMLMPSGGSRRPGGRMGGPTQMPMSATPGQGKEGYRVPDGVDPLTLEPFLNSDSRFSVNVIVVKGDTPADILAKLAAATQPAVQPGKGGANTNATAPKPPVPRP